MELNEYQVKALRTENTELNQKDLAGYAAKVYAVCKLAEEAGEVAGLMAKHIGQGHPIPDDAVKKELGDLFWHLAHAAKQWGFTLEDIGLTNLAKLWDRYPEGFSSERSINREE